MTLARHSSDDVDSSNHKVIDEGESYFQTVPKRRKNLEEIAIAKLNPESHWSMIN